MKKVKKILALALVIILSFSTIEVTTEVTADTNVTTIKLNEEVTIDTNTKLYFIPNESNVYALYVNAGEDTVQSFIHYSIYGQNPDGDEMEGDNYIKGGYLYSQYDENSETYQFIVSDTGLSTGYLKDGETYYIQFTKYIDGEESSASFNVSIRNNMTEGVLNGLHYQKTANDSINIIGYVGNDQTEVVIPSNIDGYPVETIDYMAFETYNNIKRIIINENVKEIGQYAFRGCVELEYISFPASLYDIGEAPFANVPNLNVECPNGNEYIKYTDGCFIFRNRLLSFLGGENIREFRVPEGVTSLGYYSFEDANIETVYLPASVRRIDPICFNEKLKDAYIENPSCIIYRAGEDYHGSFCYIEGTYDNGKASYYTKVHGKSNSGLELLCNDFGIQFESTGTVDETNRYSTLTEDKESQGIMGVDDGKVCYRFTIEQTGKYSIGTENMVYEIIDSYQILDSNGNELKFDSIDNLELSEGDYVFIVNFNKDNLLEAANQEIIYYLERASNDNEDEEEVEDDSTLIWDSWFGANEGWYEGAEGELVQAEKDNWTVRLDSIGWGGIWGAQMVYRKSDLNIKNGKTYTFQCNLKSTDCDKWIFISLRNYEDYDHYAYGKWIKLKKGIEISVNETFIAQNDANELWFCFGGESTGGSAMFEREVYDFLDGGAEKLDNEEATLSTKIECNNLSLMSMQEIVPTEKPTNPQEQNTRPSNVKNETSTTVSNKKPAKVSVLKVQNRKKSQIKISWKRISGVGGYQVSYATNKKFTKGKKIVQIKKSAKSAVIKKLKKKKTYYVRVRAYKIIGKKKVYGNWSSVKRIKIKK